jgi:hypothetical protein
MSGQKWRSVCQSVQRFANFLGENDLISAMVFNGEAKLLASLSAKDPLFRKKPIQLPPIVQVTTPPSNPQPQKRVVQVTTPPSNPQPQKRVVQVTTPPPQKRVR